MTSAPPVPMARRTPRRAIGLHVPAGLSGLSVLSVLVCALLALGWCLAGAASAAELTRSQVQSRQWWVKQLQLPKTWAISKGAGVTVAVFDLHIAAGFDGTPSDLDGVLVPGFSIGGAATGLTPDQRDHGSIMATEIAGRGTGFGVLGVAPQARIMPVQFGELTNENTAAALTRLAAMPDPPDVVSMSYGGPGPCPADLQSAVRAATARNIVLLAAAGNDGQAGNTAQAPADCAGVVAVGAVDSNAAPWSGSTRQSYVALGAPGVQIVCHDGQVPSGGAYDAGTSDATAIAAGEVAVVRGKFRTLSGRDLVTRMLYTTKQFQGAQGSRNTATGFGVALPYYGLTQTVPASAPNPVYDALDEQGTSAPATSAPPRSSSAAHPGSSPVTGPSSAAPGATGSTGSSGHTGLIVGVVAAVVVIGGIAVLLVARGRRRTPAYGAGPGHPWAPPPHAPPPPNPPPPNPPPPNPPPTYRPPNNPPPGGQW